MKNKVMKLGLLAMMVMGEINAAHAGNEITVTGQVLATTCDVSVPANLSLKAKPSEITAGATLFKAQDVTVTLSNCAGDPESGSQGKIRLTAPTSALGAGYFNTEANPSVGIGVAAGAGAKTPLLHDLSYQPVGVVGASPTALNGQDLVYSVGLAAPGANPQPGIANANLKFEFFYN